MKPVEFIASEDLMYVYMCVKYHDYFKNLATNAGGKFVSRSENWIYTYKIPMVSFLLLYKDIAEGFPVKLDPFLQATLGEEINTPKHEFTIEIFEPKGILPHITPKPYQLEAFSHALYWGKSIVGLPVGAGKSLTGKMFKEYIDKPFVLVCPASIKYQWRKEIREMTGKEALVIDGDPKKRRKQYAIADNYEWIILNYETFISDGDVIPVREGIIIDEAHYLKNPDSKRTKAVMKYAENNCPHVLLLTGTFLVNSLLDGWALMKLLGFTGKQTYNGFKRKHCILDDYGSPVGFLPSITDFKKDLRKVTYYRQKEEIMAHLPPRVDEFIDIAMLPEQKKWYEKLESGILEDLQDPTKSKELDPGALFTRLRQGAADPHMIFPEADTSKKMSAKIEWIADFLQSFDERTLVIYSPFNSFLERIKEELPDYPWVHIHGGVPVKKREELIEGVKESEERAFFLITDALKTGKNIQFCQHFIFTTLPTTWADYDQLRGRIWREGQKHTTFIYHLMSLESIDHSNWELIEGKKDLMNDFRIARFGATDLKKAMTNKRKAA